MLTKTSSGRWQFPDQSVFEHAWRDHAGTQFRNSGITMGQNAVDAARDAVGTYNATKSGGRSFARTWTTDLKDRRIRVNTVSPGWIETLGLLSSSEAGQRHLKMIPTVVPLCRLGTSDEIALAVIFLASDDASYVTGTELFVDGGFAQV
jgi:NAD(P)-dependent dehydrogenase (short-subunit alcohol dehydrogenase family)